VPQQKNKFFFYRPLKEKLYRTKPVYFEKKHNKRLVTVFKHNDFKNIWQYAIFPTNYLVVLNLHNFLNNCFTLVKFSGTANATNKMSHLNLP